MKVFICGKGGCGKSTLAVMIAKAVKARGMDVLLVDADESNIGLHRLVGVTATPDLMESFGGKKGFKAKLNPTFPQAPPTEPFPERFGLRDIKDRAVVSEDGIGLIGIGKIHDFGEGCACPMGVLSKKLFSGLQLGGNEVVIVDTEAGVEHFGRGVIAQGDLIVDVIDPTYESILLAGKIREMAAAGNVDMNYVCNKMDAGMTAFIDRHLDRKRVIAVVPPDSDTFMAGLEGSPLRGYLTAVEPVVDFIQEKKNGSPQLAATREKTC